MSFSLKSICFLNGWMFLGLLDGGDYQTVTNSPDTPRPPRCASRFDFESKIFSYLGIDFGKDLVNGGNPVAVKRPAELEIGAKN